ncbi:G-rich sequence factor 1 [Genypterus blacodes]|uniref:G-rich sequence factor 1 n=1 Tax=Genypterus blacodes TaxID=154954 RepID=UPI003F76662A
MFGNYKTLSLLLHRCITASYLNLSSYTTGSVRTSKRGFVQFHQKLKWTSSLRRVSPWFLIQPSFAVTTSKHRSCTKAGGPFEDEYPPLPAYQSEAEKKEVYIIQAKGFPWSCTAEDLLEFFSECRIRDGANGIHINVDSLGRSTGLAFIELEHEEDVSKALEKHRQYIGSRYVQVFEVMDSDAEAILKKDIHAPASDGVVRLRGLPFRCTEDDIISFFSGLDLVKNGVAIILDKEGRNSGEAFVQFSSQKIANEALQRNRKHMRNRYIEVFPSRSSEMHSVCRKMGSFSQSSPSSVQRKNSSAMPRSPTIVPHHSSVLPQHSVHMRGIPFHVTGEDIVEFFSPLALSKILIEFGPDGRPSGEVDVYFTCHQDAVAAISRDRFRIGSRYIELFLNSVEDST